MSTKLIISVGAALYLLTPTGAAGRQADSLRTFPIDEAVVTGTRNKVDVRHLSQTVSVVDRTEIEQSMQPSLLPVLTEQIPGLFTTARGIMGYGVSGGAAGGMSLRGLSGGSARMMVLIDGHPQYAGIFGHPIADSYQSLLAEKVEVLRGPASVLYGSNAMGGVVNIVTGAGDTAVRATAATSPPATPAQRAAVARRSPAAVRAVSSTAEGRCR